MNDNATSLSKLLERTEDFSKSTIQLFKLTAIDKAADSLSSLVSSIVYFFAVALSLLIINIGLALWLGNMFGDSYLGFFAVGGFYAFVVLILSFFRNRWIKLPISNIIIRELQKKKEASPNEK